MSNGIRDLPESNKESIRATVTNILKYSKPPTTCNLSRQQKLALKNLREDDSITIIPADKGKAIVVMDNDDYTSKISDLLSDKETYLKITDRRRKPVSKVEKDLIKAINNRANPADCVAPSFVVLPYVKGVAEKISRVLRRENIKVCYKPTTTLSYQFPKPKDNLPPEQTSGVIYKICCCDCEFVYYGQADRALKTRIREHERAVSQFDQYSKVAKHSEQYDHRIDFSNATIVNKKNNYRERLFLEAWYSLKDHNAGNDHVEIPDVYKTLIC
jgi:hypothetical protein